MIFYEHLRIFKKGVYENKLDPKALYAFLNKLSREWKCFCYPSYIGNKLSANYIISKASKSIE